MCGIVGALTFGKFSKKAEEKLRQESIMFMTTDLLQQTVERGKDATGVSLLFEDGNYMGLKMGIESPAFITRFGETEKDFKGLMKIWREYPQTMRVYLGHCRKASVGNSYDNKNNHPIRVGDTIAIKNGTLKNHDIIFEKLGCGRDGEVDSEAVVRLLHHYTDNGAKPFTTKMLTDITLRLDGSFSVLGVCANNPFQVAQFRDLRPAEMVLIRPLKTVLIASEKKYLQNTLFEYTKMAHLMEPAVKFAKITEKDLDWKVLPDESVAVWDLTTEITGETEIGDLYSWEKSTVTSQKIWKEPVKTYGATNTNTHQNTNWNKNKSSVNASSKSSKSTNKNDDDDDDNVVGLVWSKRLDKYKTQDKIDETKKMGSVELDAESGDVKRIDAKGAPVNEEQDKDEVSGLNRVAEDKVETLVTGAATVEEIALDDVNEAVNEEKGKEPAGFVKAKKSNGAQSGGKSTKQSKPVDPDVKEIDMSQDPDALARAEEFVNKGLSKYTDDKEVLSDIEYSPEHDDVLKHMPIFALANRIQRFFARKYFYMGYRARKAEETGADTKDAKAEKTIRILKTTTKILAHALDSFDQPKLEKLTRAALKEIVKSSNVLSADQIDQAFSVGDIKNIPLLTVIKRELTSKK